MSLVKSLAIMGISFLVPISALAGPDDFTSGKTIPQYGKIAPVDVDQPVHSYSKFKITFDTVNPAKPGELNLSLIHI